jgi:sporulation protein YhbH
MPGQPADGTACRVGLNPALGPGVRRDATRLETPAQSALRRRGVSLYTAPVALKIDQDHGRFRHIVRGRIRENLRKFISKGELIGRKGKDRVSIPIPRIDIPRFRYGDKQKGGVGQGDGEPGDPLDAQEGEGGKGKAGQGEGDHILEVDVTIEELAEILGEELELPDIEPKGQSRVREAHDRYSGMRRTGPETLRHFRRTYREALKRMIMSGTFNPQKPVVVPTPEDKRYRSWKTTYEPRANAVIIYMMDVSGSMGDEQKEIVRIESFWIDTWLSSQYKGLEARFIIHDAVAREVDRETFFTTHESGGTMISSAYKLCAQMIDNHYPPTEWNIYPFHFSDGDNWSVDDTLLCVELLKTRIRPRVNMFCYGQVESPYGSGQFVKDLREHLGEDECVITSEIRDKDAIVKSIKDFLGKGH